MSKPYTKWSTEDLDDAIFDHDCHKKDGHCPCIEWTAELERRYQNKEKTKQFYKEFKDERHYAEAYLEPEESFRPASQHLKTAS